MTHYHLHSAGLRTALVVRGVGSAKLPGLPIPFNPYVWLSRIRLTDSLLGMVTPSDSERCRVGDRAPDLGISPSPAGRPVRRGGLRPRLHRDMSGSALPLFI